MHAHFSLHFGCYINAQHVHARFIWINLGDNGVYRICVKPFFQHVYAAIIGVAPITKVRTCVIKIATFKRGHLMW